jgi:hypothetical protein
MFTHAVLITSAIFLTFSAHAAPPNSGDGMDRILAEKGLLVHMDKVRQNVTNKASELVFNAMGFLGVPYRRGGTSADTGFDCSGFVRAMYEQSVGLLLPRRAEQQAAATQNIARDELQPGDLVFFNTMRRAFSHVGIYVGEGKFIHAPKPGARVRVESLSMSYWNRRFDGARRVATTSSGSSDSDADQSPQAASAGTQLAADMQSSLSAPNIQAAQIIQAQLRAQ